MKKLSTKINEAEEAKTVLEVNAKIDITFEIPTSNIFVKDFIEKNINLMIKDANNLKINDVEVIAQEDKVYEDFVFGDKDDKKLPEINNSESVAKYIINNLPINLDNYLDDDAYITFCDYMEDYFASEKERAIKDLNA